MDEYGRDPPPVSKSMRREVTEDRHLALSPTRSGPGASGSQERGGTYQGGGDRCGETSGRVGLNVTPDLASGLA